MIVLVNDEKIGVMRELPRLELTATGPLFKHQKDNTNDEQRPALF